MTMNCVHRSLLMD